jgi:Uma2 family endonuclease
VNALVEQLLASPSLPEMVDLLQRHLEEERVRRQQFYRETTEEQKAEFIDGQVIIHSPAAVRHLEVRDNLHGLLKAFVRSQNLGMVAGERALCAFPRNDYEPDICFFSPEKAALLTPVTMNLPIPDFIAEVLSESTEERDRGRKFQDYQEHGVGEYWIIDPCREILEQYLLDKDAYQLSLKSGTGEVRSVAVAGFVIPIRALFDASLNLFSMRQILA